MPGEDRLLGDAEGLRLGAKLRGQVAVTHDQQARPWLALQHAGRGIEQEGVTFLRAQPSDRAEDQGLVGKPEAASQRERPHARHRSEHVERGAVPDETHAVGWHEALADEEVARRAAHGDGAVGVTAQQPVGERLVAGQRRVGEVLVQHQPRAGGARREPAEVGGGVAVDVQDPGAARAHERNEVAQDPRIEAAAPEVVHRDALLAQPRGRGLLMLQPHERRRVARLVVAGEPPGEEARHAVDAGAAHPELVADVEHRDGHRRQAPADGAARGCRRVSHATAPDSDSSTIRPAPTMEKARALSRGSPTWAKYTVNRPSRRPQPLNEIGHGLQQRAQRDHEEGGGHR